MKRMLLMIAAMISISLILNGEWFFADLAQRELGTDDIDFIRLFDINLLGSVNLQEYVNLHSILYSMTTFVAYLFMFGHYMSDNLNVSDIYFFIRENNRTKWFVKQSVSMFLQSAFIAVVNMSVIYFMTCKMCINSQPESIKQLVGITAVIILYVWLLTMVSNFFSVLFGSVIGLSVGAALHYALVITACYTYDVKIIKSVNPLAVIFNVADSRQGISSAVISMAVILAIVCAAFCFYVNKADISLNNKEAVM